MERRLVQLGNEQGIAMMFSLVALVILSTLTLSFLNLSSTAVEKTETIIKRAQSQAEAEGAIHVAIFNLVNGEIPTELHGNSHKHQVEVGNQKIEVAVNNACGRWDINEGDLKILDALLTELGSTEHTDFIEAIKKARAMPSGFQSTDQILSIPGLQGEMKRRLMEEITLQCRSDAVDKVSASSTLKRAIKTFLDSYNKFPPQRIYRIAASNSKGPGTYFSINAYIEVLENHERPFKIIDWKVN